MSPLTSMIVSRLGLGVMTLVAVSAVVFFSMALLPGDIAQRMLGQAGTPEAVANIRHDLGLDRPIGQRYVSWMSGVLHGDFGRSLASGRPIAQIAKGRLMNTLFLASFAAIVSVPLSVGLGILAALYRRRPVDTAINVFTLLTISFPEFLIAYLLIYLFTVEARWAPSLAVVGADTPLPERLHKTVLPVMTLTLAVAAHMTRLTRAAIVNVLASPYIEMAHLKGLSAWRVIVRHALPNALGPIISVVVLNLAYLIVGVVVVEVVFTYPGARAVDGGLGLEARCSRGPGFVSDLRRYVHHAQSRGGCGVHDLRSAPQCLNAAQPTHVAQARIAQIRSGFGAIRVGRRGRVWRIGAAGAGHCALR